MNTVKPDKTQNGSMVDGAYWSEDHFGKYEDQTIESLQEGFIPYEACLSDNKTGSITIWAHNQKEAVEIAEHLTTEEMNEYVAWNHIGQTIDMNAPRIRQTKEHRMRSVTLVARDQDGLNVTLHAIHIKTALPDNKIIPAIKAAAWDYLNTPEGKEVWEANCHNFNYGDFDLHVSNEFCIPHGFYLVVKGVTDIIEDDFNTALAEPKEQ